VSREGRPYDDLIAELGVTLIDIVQRIVADALLGLVRQAVADAVADLTPTLPDTAVAVSVAETAKRLNLGLTTTKGLVTSGQIDSILVDRRRLVPVEAIQDYVRRLRSAAAPMRALPGQEHRSGPRRRTGRRTGTEPS
jgi:hypothetical protein